MNQIYISFEVSYYLYVILHDLFIKFILSYKIVYLIFNLILVIKCLSLASFLQFQLAYCLLFYYYLYYCDYVFIIIFIKIGDLCIFLCHTILYFKDHNGNKSFPNSFLCYPWHIMLIDMAILIHALFCLLYVCF